MPTTKNITDGNKKAPTDSTPDAISKRLVLFFRPHSSPPPFR